MSDPLPVAGLILGIITVIVILEVLVLIIPLRISLSFCTREQETKAILLMSWFIFGLELLVPGKEPRVAVMVGGVRLVTLPVSFLASPGKKSVREGPVPGQFPGTISSLLSLRGPVTGAILDLVRHTRVDYVRGTARIGLGNPGTTGLMYGLYWAIRSIIPTDRLDVTLIPEFNDEVFEADIKTRFSITDPFLVLVNVVKLLKHPATRNVMKTMKGKPAEVAA